MREVTPPTAEPLTLEEVRIHLRQLGDADPDASPSDPLVFDEVRDDSWVNAKITAARQWCEDFLGTPLTDAVYVEGYDTFAGQALSLRGFYPWPYQCESFWQSPHILLPEGATEVVAVTYLDEDNALQTVGPSSYQYDEFSRRLYIDDTATVSTTRHHPVRVQFRGPYGGDSPALAVPENIKHAMLLLIGDWHRNRGDDGPRESTDLSVTGERIESLLRPQRVRLGMA